MRREGMDQFRRATAAGAEIAVTILMPCLNEARCLPHCVASAREALARIEQEYGLSGEIVIADNGSTDGSQVIAAALGARVVPVAARGYGAALIGGGKAAFGRYVLMADADGSYDFNDGVAMIGSLHAGADLCMGSRFKGGISPGAMPWKNRHIGNPLLTGTLNLLFRSGIEDAHCGLRAIRREAFHSLGLTGSGMEFASEMVIKAALRGMRIDEVPAKLLVDLRDRAPHLRPWRDGWRHLRYLFMLSPTWVFAAPAMLGAAAGLLILIGALLSSQGLLPPLFGSSWTFLGAALLGLGHLGGIMAVATHLYGVLAGYRTPHRMTRRLRKILTLETMLISGALLAIAGFGSLALIAAQWSAGGFVAMSSPLPVATAIAVMVIGVQNVLGGFLLAVVGGNEAAFLERIEAVPEPTGWRELQAA